MDEYARTMSEAITRLEQGFLDARYRARAILRLIPYAPDERTCINYRLRSIRYEARANRLMMEAYHANEKLIAYLQAQL